MTTLGARLEHYRGLGPGFDFLRIGLACAIVVFHAYWLSGDTYLRTTGFWFGEYALVPMFFALSGFLISGSALRLTLYNFLLNRGLRILPALAVDVVFCALVIGPVMTTFALSKYFADPDFFRYFLNVTGWMHYHLPGVFSTLPTYRVNGSLWSVPYEMLCYGIISCLILSKAMLNPRAILAVILIFMATGLVAELVQSHISNLVFTVLRFLLISRGGQTITAFLMGIGLYVYRDRIPYSWPLLGLSVVICGFAIAYLETADIEHVLNRFLVLPALVYITVFLGLTPIPVPAFLRKGDYSYGVYLYHAPLLQVLISLAPGVFLKAGSGPAFLTLFGIPAVGIFAAFSWHNVEKPVLGLRKRFSFVAKVRGVAHEGEDTIAPAPVIDARQDYVGTEDELKSG